MGQPEFASSCPDEASQSAFDKKKNAEILASGYTKTKRTIEITSVSVFVILLIISFVRITSSLYFLRNFWVTLCACVLSMCVADFFSGIAHCMFLSAYQYPYYTLFYFYSLFNKGVLIPGVAWTRRLLGIQ